jgi:hypothetical protein
MEGYSAEESSGRFGTVGNVLLGLVGLVLVLVGAFNVIAVQAGSIPTLFTSEAINYGVSAFLVVIGLAANLAAAASRV